MCDILLYLKVCQNLWEICSHTKDLQLLLMLTFISQLREAEKNVGSRGFFFFRWFPVSFQLRNTSGYLPSKANFCGWNEKLTVIKWPIRKNYSITLSPNPFTPFLLRLREPSPKSQTAKKNSSWIRNLSLADFIIFSAMRIH